MLSPYKISWDGLSSLEFDVIVELAFESDSGAVETHLSKEAVVSETYNGVLKRVHGYKWSESFTFQLTLIKNDFGNFTAEENRRILKWLTGRPNAGFIDIYKDDSEVIEFSALGNFVNVSTYKLGNGRVVGYVADWESLMPYALSRLHTVSKKISSAEDNRITIEIDTDESQSAVYPRVTITHDGNNFVRIADDKEYDSNSKMLPNTAYYNGTTFYWKPSTAQLRTSNARPADDYNKDWPVKITTKTPTMNEMEDKTVYSYNGKFYWIDPSYTFRTSLANPNLETTSVKLTNTHYNFFNVLTSVDEVAVQNNTLTEKIVLDGANKIVASTNTRRIFGDDFVDWHWLELYDGKNEIVIEGNCTVTLEWREVRKVGEW